MTKKVLAIAAVCFLLAAGALGQNYISVTATNIIDLSGEKLAVGKFCFLGTNASDVPINYQAGGGGQVTTKEKCVDVLNGAVTPFEVANPALTFPPNIRYRIWAKDKNNNVVVMYRNSVVSGATFNFDTFVPSTSDITPVGKFLTQDHTIAWERPTLPDDSGRWSKKFSLASVLQSASCDTDQDSATVVLEIRSAPNVSGTTATSVMTCTTTESSGTVISSAIPANYFVTVVPVSITGAPPTLRVHFSTK